MIDKAMLQPFAIEKKFTSDDLSATELDVIKSSVNKDTSLSREVKDSLNFKLNSMIDSRKCYTVDDQIINYIERHGRADTPNFDFFNNPIEGKIEICDTQIGDYVFDHKGVPVEEIADQFSDEQSIRLFRDTVRFCEDCGRPISKGYTNEESFLCDNAEFAIHMDKIYGQGNWYCGPDEYYALDERDGKYKPTGWYVIDFE